MPIVSNPTYQTLIDSLMEYITTNCVNIANYSGLEACFKAGYSSGAVQFAGNGTASSVYTYKLTGNAVTRVYSSTVTTDLTNFLYNIGIGTTAIPLSSEIANSNLLQFMNDLGSFCAARLYYTASAISSNPTTNYLIYKTGTVTYNNTLLANTAENGLTITNTDATTLLDNILTNLRSNIRFVPCKYSVSLTGRGNVINI